MEMAAIIALVAKAAQVAIAIYPTVIKTAEDLKPFAMQLYKQFAGKEEVSEAEQTEIEKMIDNLSAELQLPLPPE